MSDTEEPDYLRWSPSKPPAEPEPPTEPAPAPPVDEAPAATAPPAVPEGYVPPTTDGTGFSSVHAHAKQPTTMRDLSVDVSNLSWDERRQLSFRLAEANTKHRLEGTVLVADLESATAVQGEIDRILSARPAPSASAPSEEPTAAAVAAEPPAPSSPADVAEWSGSRPTEEPVAEVDEPAEPVDWLHPEPVEAAVPVDEPVVERDEPEEIVVPPSEDVDEVIDALDEDEDEVVFDLASLSVEERRHLSMRLTGAGIAHIWEVATDLVVSVTDAASIETFLDEVRNPDGFGEEEMIAFDSDEEVDDEAIYAAMSNLYVASDKLMQRVSDPTARTDFYNATDDVDGLPAPFGFDPRVWSQVLDLAVKIADAMDAEADDDTIATDARSLRQLLVNFV